MIHRLLGVADEEIVGFNEKNLDCLTKVRRKARMISWS
jgi:hypothetical protein